VVGAVPPIVTSIVAAWKLSQDDVEKWLIAAMCGIPLWLLAVCVLKVFQAQTQDSKDDESSRHDGLTGALAVLHAHIANCGGLSSDAERRKVRVTFHRVVPPLEGAEYIEQIVEYVGGSGDGPGRTFSIRSGLTGKAIRERKAYTMERKSESFDEYKKELVKDWNYIADDVKNFTSDRFSAMAVPITSKPGNGQSVIGVVYLDSSIKGFFKNTKVRTEVLVGCMGITEYTGSRYV